MRLLLLLVPIWLLHPVTAQAADDAGASAGAGYFNAYLQQNHSASQSNGDLAASATSSSVTYAYDPQCVRGSGLTDAFYGCGEQQTCGQDGALYNVWAQTPDGLSTLAGTYCDEPTVAAPVAVLTPERILEAFRRVPLPTTPLEVQPPGGRTLVNFDTILHTDAEPFRESVQLLNRTVEFDIEPSEFTWSLGDGTSFTTTDPGRAWREGLSMSEYVSHRYEKAGDVDLQLTTTWSARWRVGGGPWRPVQGTVDTTSPPVSLDVVTARPQLVSYD